MAGMRFRPRFSLRTLLIVVAVLGIWLGLEVRPVQIRKQWLKTIDAGGGDIYFADTYRETRYRPGTLPIPPEISWFRRLLGDRAVLQLTIVTSDPSDKERSDVEIAPIKAAFPEAMVNRGTKAARRPTSGK